MDGTPLSSPTPFTPPTTEEDRLAWLRLIRSRRVGATTFSRLMREHGCAHAALDALPAVARASGVASYSPCTRADAEREIERGRKLGARLVCLGESEYSTALAAIDAPPPVLWTRGRATLAARPSVSIVGARNASSLGLRIARKLAAGLGHHEHAVTSGLARGIDTAAHSAALKTGTIAVLAGGIDVIYPAENAVLAASIADQGLLLSDQPIGTRPTARHFPRRNRLIAGLSRGVVVVEAAQGSGSLITARDALDMGREVFAVPGNPLDARAAGCNALIRDGALLVRDVDDILEALAPSVGHDRVSSKIATKPVTELPPVIDTLTLHRQILAHLSTTPVAEDQLLRDLNLPSTTVAPALLFLELDGRVARHPGGMLALSRG